MRRKNKASEMSQKHIFPAKSTGSLWGKVKILAFHRLSVLFFPRERAEVLKYFNKNWMPHFLCGLCGKRPCCQARSKPHRGGNWVA